MSFYPLFSERDAVLVPEIEGSWEFDAFGVDTVSFEKVGDNFYDAVLRSGGITSRFEAVFTELGGSLFLDLLPTKPTANCSESNQEYSVPVHSWIRIAVIGDTMWLADMQYRWFYDNIIAKKSMGSYLLNESKVILTLPIDDLRAFLNEHLHAGGFLSEETVARRLGRAASYIDSGGSTDQKMKSTNAWTGLIHSGQRCVPSFPYQDGWLGGDGGLPVPISASKTVWLFGDSFVGQKDQKNLQGASMVTTIGVSTCEADGNMTMRYYWRNMYTDHPDHFFQPHTSRYKFWPAVGFMYRGNMYVIMFKIGPLLGSSPDNIFNWSALGTTLAKVTAPAASPPDKWKIDLIPWSRALDVSLFQGGYAQDSSFGYFFTVKNDGQNYLLRLPLDRLESPDGNMEYLSQDGTWKPGSDSADAEVLFEDQLISRVIYVPGLHHWLAVYGPHFGGSSIYFRTAPRIVGPWSERRILYDCPELVESSPQYDESNFCYCAQVLSVRVENGVCKLLIDYSCLSSKPSRPDQTAHAEAPRVVEIAMPR
ncbi:MAG: hypothetical protein NT028_11470 [candidate division Zixibacteria bacterium]|nr:hypothetical protein [candidate division Zixibacteria bacterium]